VSGWSHFAQEFEEVGRRKAAQVFLAMICVRDK
jgi:hypothetical protein